MLKFFISGLGHFLINVENCIRCDEWKNSIYVYCFRMKELVLILWFENKKGRVRLYL